jgi:hypothetical protein
MTVYLVARARVLTALPANRFSPADNEALLVAAARMMGLSPAGRQSLLAATRDAIAGQTDATIRTWAEAWGGSPSDDAGRLSAFLLTDDSAANSIGQPLDVVGRWLGVIAPFVD